MAFLDFLRRKNGVPEGEQMTESVPQGDVAQERDEGRAADGTGKRIGVEDIRKAAEVLKKYKRGKEALEARVVEDELWWQQRHWEVIRRAKKEDPGPEPTSGWLFNAIVNKHADAMDNIPEPVALPREQSDEESARVLSSVLPVVMETNRFEGVYDANWWEKLKHGTGAYGVFWNSRKENGLGDIDIKGLDLLKIFWEPGVRSIQASRNLFIVELVEEEVLDKQYPQYAGKMANRSIEVKEYLCGDEKDAEGKSLVVDWYYKVQNQAGKTVLHYAKFVGDVLLYASENDERYRERGFYDHGQYPVVLDVLFPEKDTPVGFGYVAICKNPQLYIDKLSANIMEASMMGTKKRWFISSSTGINKDQFLDWNEPFVEVEGELDERRMKEITVGAPDGIYLSVMTQKIEEMKDTASNRDVNSGGSAGFVFV